MDVKTQLPELEDAELTNIRNNAHRLLSTGTTKQQAAAAALMPSIEAEWEARAAAKITRRNEGLAARRAANGKAARGTSEAAKET